MLYSMLKDTMTRLSRYVPTVQSETLSNLVGFTLLFPNYPRKESKVKVWRQVCRCGKGHLCQRSCPGLEVWTSGQRHRRSFERDFIHMSKRSLEGVVKVFGFTIRVHLRTLPGGTICYYSGPKLILDTLRTFPFSVKSFSTWLRAKLTLVVSVSFILSVAALGTLISVLLFLLTRLLRLKTNFLAFSRRLVKMLRRISS